MYLYFILEFYLCRLLFNHCNEQNNFFLIDFEKIGNFERSNSPLEILESTANEGKAESEFSPTTTNIHPSTRHLPGQTSQAPRTETLRMPAACFSFKWFIHTGILRDAFHAFYVPAKRIPRTCVRSLASLVAGGRIRSPPPPSSTIVRC